MGQDVSNAGRSSFTAIFFASVLVALTIITVIRHSVGRI